MLDCNENGFIDAYDIGNNLSEDCNGNYIPDECDVALGSQTGCDNNANGIPDICDMENEVCEPMAPESECCYLPWDPGFTGGGGGGEEE